MERHGDWIDSLDREIFPFVEYPEYEHRYPAKTLLPLSGGMVDEIRDASEKLFGVFRKVTRVFQDCPDDFFGAMEIPEKLRPYLALRDRNPLGIPTWLSRFDFVLDEGLGLHMVEINADTPCAVVQAFYGNKVACDAHGVADPNEGEHGHLKDWLLRVFRAAYAPQVDLASGGFSAKSPFAFACFDDYIEDRGTTLFLMRAMREAIGTMYPEKMLSFVSFYDLKVTPDGRLALPDGRVAAALYRLHPLEILIEETADDGGDLGKMLMDGYASGKFSMMNPPEAIIMQSKAFQALVWVLAGDTRHGDIFTPSEMDAIQKYLLPTYFGRDFGEADKPMGELWIRKPIWGREGNGIDVIDGLGNVLMKKQVPNAEEIVQRDSGQVAIQQFVRQPTCEATTDGGDLVGYPTLSCFMLGKESSAIYARFSTEQVAGTEAYWLPVRYA